MVRNDRPAEARRRSASGRVLVMALLASAAPTLVLGQSREPDAALAAPADTVTPWAYARTPAPAGTDAAPIHPGNWPRLRLADPIARGLARKALDLAWQRLEQTDCRAVVDGFSDAAGRPLQHRLATLSVDVQTYLTLLVFIDGTRERPCIAGVLAFTTPGSRVVRICVDQLKHAWRQSPDHTTANFIHEMLHTLGLGENPPSPAAITTRVLAACFRRP